MNDETQPTDTGEPVVKEPSLDEIISEYNVQSQDVKTSEQAAETHPTRPLPAKVDPLDEAQFQDFTQQVDTNQSVLSNQIRNLDQKLTQIEQREAELRVEADISNAVQNVNDGLNLDPKLVRVHLEYTAQDKPGFKKVWENRYKDPQTYDKALKAVKREIEGLYKVKQDADLTETQTAIQQSQQSLAARTAPKETSEPEERLANAKTQAEFDMEWRRLTGG